MPITSTTFDLQPFLSGLLIGTHIVQHLIFMPDFCSYYFFVALQDLLKGSLILAIALSSFLLHIYLCYSRRISS